MKASSFLLPFLISIILVYSINGYSNSFQHIKSKLTIALLAAKKKSSSSSSSFSSPTSSPRSPVSPPRVNTNTNIPIRQQIAWAKAAQRLNKLAGGGSGGAKFIVTKKFKKEKGPKQEEETYREIDYVNTKPPAIFVDGYNIIGFINRVEGRNIDLEDARDCLISDLSVLRGATGWWIEVVFDAYMAARSSGSSSFVDNILVTFTAKDDTADSHIERRFSDLAKEGYTNMIVATDDNLLRMVAGSAGSGFLSADMLLEEFRIAYRGWENVQSDMEAEARKSKPNIASGISNEMKAVIEEMKQNSINLSNEADNERKEKIKAIEDAKLEKKKGLNRSNKTKSTVISFEAAKAALMDSTKENQTETQANPKKGGKKTLGSHINDNQIDIRW